MKAKNIFLLLLLLLCPVVTVCAQETNRLSVSDKRMQRGSESQLTIEMDNINEIVAAQFTLTMPSGLTLKPASAILTDRGADHTVTARNMGNNQYKFVIISSTNTPLKGIKGALVSVNMTASSDLQENEDYEITMSDAVMGVKSGENVINETANGTVHIATLPNLHVTSLDCSEAIAGSTMTISWTVRNDGKGDTGDVQWNDYVWLVPDVQGGTAMTGAQLLKTVSNVSALSSGESYSNTVNVQLEERIYGNYDVVVATDMRSISDIDLSSVGNVLPRPYEPTDTYLYATTNAAYNKVDEENETSTSSDNFRYKAIEIHIPPLADLQVPTVTVVVDNSESYSGENSTPSPISTAGLASSTAFYSGKKIKVTATVQNKGGAATSKKNIASALYISHNADREDGLDKKLTTTNTTISLNPDEAAEVTFTAQIPYEWSGDTYFHVQVDLNDVVYESANTENNWGKTQQVNVLMTPGADFEPTSIKVPATVSLGAHFDVIYSVENIGAGVPFSSTWTDSLYISSSQNGLDDNAIYIGSNTRTGKYKLNGQKYVFDGDSYIATCPVQMPSYNSDACYLYVKVDANDDVFEYDGENNNVRCSSKIEVKNTDLKATLVSVSEGNMITGDEVAVAWAISNVGESDISNRSITDGIYASSNADGTDPVLLYKVANTVSLAKGVTKTFRANITIPMNAKLNGLRYVFVKTNIENEIVESNTDNNKTDNVQRTFEYINPEDVENMKVNGTNLTVHSLTIPAETSIGESISIAFAVKNTGTFAIEKDVKIELFLCKNKSFDMSSAIPLYVDDNILPSTADLQPNASKNCTVNATTPSDIVGGAYYLYAFVNREKAVSEKTYKDNYIYRSLYVNGNLPDLAISELSVPAEIKTAEPVEISWTVSNNGSWEANATTATIYISNDATPDKTDKRVENVKIENLKAGISCIINYEITIDDGVVGDKYIIVSIDNYKDIEESDETNNIATAKFTSIQSPVPDLDISGISVEGELKAGQTAIVKAIVKNNGVAPTRKDKWADAFYLCSDYNFNQKTATELGSKTHVGILKSGETYELTTTIKIPTDAQGYYVLYAVTDANNTIYETNKANNQTHATVSIANSSSTPVELSVSNLSVPSTITAGETISISYDIQNISDNAANGILRDVIYMSKDSKLDADDIMVGVVSGEVSLEAGNSTERIATGRITNMVEGDYYIIVKTNSAHSIAETDYENNYVVSTSASSLKYARLSLGETASLNTSGLFKLSVHDGHSSKTLGLQLAYPEENPATLYAAYESVPTTAKYERKSAESEDDEQELLIPDVQSGNYYVLAQANSATNKNLNEFVLSGQTSDSDIPMTISASEVQFGATSLSIREGGNGGWITTDVRGALFDSIMDFRLLLDKKYIPAESITFKDQTSTKTIFNLNDAKVGSYDIVSELPDGTQATLPNGFQVVSGTSVGLGVKLEGPSVVHSGSSAPISVTYANGGNTDARIKEFLIVIDKGYLATSIEGLKECKPELHLVPDTGVDNRGYASIPPGEKRTINCFMQQVAATSHLTIYIVK